MKSTGNGKANGQIVKDLQAISEQTGKDVKLLYADWAGMMQQGVIASVHIGRWRGRRKLDRDDLGLPLTDKQFDDLMRLGEKLLLPQDLMRELDAVESGARKAVTDYGYRTYWGQFVPVTAYAEFKEVMDGYQARYYALRDRLWADYADIYNQMRDKYREAADVAYDRLVKLKPNTFYDRENFVVAFVVRILSNIPDRDTIYRSFYFNVDLSYIPLPSLLAEDKALAAGIEYQLQADLDLLKAEKQAKLDVIAAEKKAGITQAEMRELQLREMNRDIVERARTQKQQLVDGFLRDVAGQLHNLIYDACTDVLAAVQNKGEIGARSIVQLNKMIAAVGRLNFWNDADAAALVQKVQQEITDVPASSRDAGNIEKTLRSISTVVRSNLLDLGERPASVRELGIDDVLPVEVVKLARKSLNLDAVIPEPANDTPVVKLSKPRAWSGAGLEIYA